MKTDRFTDIIRRKLESIRPEFTDKDWARMQATLKDANLSNPNAPGANPPFSGGVMSGQSWLLAAASVSTVALIAFSVWQQREISTLRQTIGQLNQHSKNAPVTTQSHADLKDAVPSVSDQSSQNNVADQRKNGTPIPNRNESQAVRPDTVYITRYMESPTRAKPDTRKEGNSGSRLDGQTEERYAAEKPLTTPSVNERPVNPLNQTQQSDSHDAISTPSVAENTRSESVKTSPSTAANSVESMPVPAGQTKVSNGRIRKDIESTSSNVATTKATRQKTGNNGRQELVTSQTVSPATSAEPSTNDVAQSSSSDVRNAPLATYELASSLPLSLESKNWNVSLAQRARRMRPAQPSVVLEKAKAVSAPASRRPTSNLALRVRAGVGAEAASQLWSMGVFSEVLLGRHFVLGLGLSQATYTSRFSTDQDFDRQMQRDFRKDFARKADGWREIVNIDTKQQRIQLPVNVGYRIALNNSLSLVPSVGTYLNMSNSENITYYCPQPMFPIPPQKVRDYEQIDVSTKSTVALVSNVVLGTGVEWQSRHFVLQASPVFNVPVELNSQNKQSTLNWQQNATLGLRARVLYQF